MRLQIGVLGLYSVLFGPAPPRNISCFAEIAVFGKAVLGLREDILCLLRIPRGPELLDICDCLHGCCLGFHKQLGFVSGLSLDGCHN